MPGRKGLLAPQNTFLDTIATRFDGTHSNFVLGNAQVPPQYPIVYCSDGFCELTGFSRAQIMQKGCSCKFLYGPDTAEDHKNQIEKALETKTELKLEVVLYKKNGNAFWCLFDLVPIKNEKREVVLFLASHKDVTHLRLSAALDSNASKHFQCDYDANENLDAESPPTNNNYARRRSRAVLYQLSGHYTQRKGKGKLQASLLQAGSAPPMPEYKTTAVPKSNLVIPHYGLFKTCWDWITLLATFYVAIVVPYNAAFVNQARPFMVGDVIVEAFFLVDLALNFRTTFVNKKGEVVTNPKRISVHYIRTWFLIDLLSALPFDLLYAAGIYSEDMTQIHLLKMLRLLRLARLFHKMDRYAQYSAMVLTLLMLFFTLVAHWLACVWYVIAEEEKAAKGPNWDLGWLHALAEKLNVDVGNITRTDAYLTALYFTCSSLTSVGFGNVSANTGPEKIFSICTMLIGALMHAAVFGNVTAIIQRMYSRRSLYQSRWRDLKDFITLHQVPRQLKQRMEDYFQTMWSLHHGIDVHETLKEFPEELRGDISMHLHREFLQLPIFEMASQGCLKLLSAHIRANFCAPGEYLLHRGDALHYIYYICNGSMEVVQNDMVVAILGKGDMIGCDINLHIAEAGAGEIVVRSSSDVRALTYCDLKSVSITGLLEVLRLYPEFQEQFASDIQHDLTFNLREGYEADDNEDWRVRSQTLPSISEDDEGASGDPRDNQGCLSSNPGSPTSALSPNPSKCRASENEGESSNHVNKVRPIRVRDHVLLRPVGFAPSLQAKSMEFLNVEVEQTRCSVERLDTQVTALQNDIGNLGHEVRSTLGYLQKLQAGLQISANSTTLWPGNSDSKSTQTEFSLSLFTDVIQANKQQVLNLLLNNKPVPSCEQSMGVPAMTARALSCTDMSLEATSLPSTRPSSLDTITNNQEVVSPAVSRPHNNTSLVQPIVLVNGLLASELIEGPDWDRINDCSSRREKTVTFQTPCGRDLREAVEPKTPFRKLSLNNGSPASCLQVHSKNNAISKSASELATLIQSQYSVVSERHPRNDSATASHYQSSSELNPCRKKSSLEITDL